MPKRRVKRKAKRKIKRKIIPPPRRVVKARRRAELELVCVNCGAPMRGLIPRLFGVRPSKKKRGWCNRCAP